MAIEPANKVTGWAREVQGMDHNGVFSVPPREIEWNGWDHGSGIYANEIRSDFLMAPCSSGIFTSTVQCGFVLSFLFGHGLYTDFALRWVQYNASVLDICFFWPGTILCHAVIGGNIEVVEKLIRLGANVNLKNHSGVCALFVAIEHNEWSIVHVLLRNGANPNVANRDGVTMFAYVADRFARLYKCNQRSLIPPAFPEQILVDLAHVDNMRLLIRYGANIEQIQPFSMFCLRRITAASFLKAPRIYPTSLLSKLLRDVFEEWENGPHASQRWLRRKAFVRFLAESMFRPLKRHNEELSANAVPPSASIPRLEGTRHALVMRKAFIESGIIKCITSFL